MFQFFFKKVSREVVSENRRLTSLVKEQTFVDSDLLSADQNL